MNDHSCIYDRESYEVTELDTILEEVTLQSTSAQIDAFENVCFEMEDFYANENREMSVRGSRQEWK